MIFGMGMLELGVTFSFEQLIIDDQIVTNAKQFISKDLAMDNLNDLAWVNHRAEKGFPAGVWSQDNVRPSLSLQSAAALLSSKRDSVDEAQQKLKGILERHKPEPLPASVIRGIREIIVDAEERKVNELKRC